MAQVKGTAIRGAFKFARHVGNGEGSAALVEALPERIRPVFAARILAGEWYPYEAYGALLGVIDRRLGGGDLSLMTELGHFAARESVRNVLKVVSVFGSVERFLARGSLFWDRTCDTGTMVAEPCGPGRLGARLEGVPELVPEHCHLLVGWLEGLVLAVGARTARVEKVACIHRGDPLCAYEGGWT